MVLPEPVGGAAAEVAAGETVGDGHGLDGEGVVEAARVEGADELGGHAELGEGGGGHGGEAPWVVRVADGVREGGRTPRHRSGNEPGVRETHTHLRRTEAATTITRSERTPA